MLVHRDRTEAALWHLDQARIDPPKPKDEDALCRRPGRYGCGQCVACEAWADWEMAA